MFRYIIFLHFFIITLFANNNISIQNNNFYPKNKSIVTINNKILLVNNFEIRYLKDTTKLLKLKDILNKRFEKTSKNGFSLGYANQNLWIKIDLLNKSDEKKFILSLNETFYEKANLYYKQNDKWIKKTNSLFKPIYKREIPFNKLSFKFDLPKDIKQSIYIELYGQYSYFGKVIIYKANSFILKNFFDINNLYIFIFGITFIILIFSTVSIFVLKEKIYLYYTGYIFFNLIYLIKISGMLVYLNLQDYIYILHMSVAYFDGFLLLFSLEYLGIKHHFKKYYTFLRAISIIYFLIGLAFFFDYRPWNQILNAMSLMIIIFLVPLSIYIYLKGYKKSNYYTLALFSYFFFAMVFILMLAGILEYTTFTRYGLSIGTAIENTIFSIMLISRYNELKNKKLKSQKELLLIKNNQKKILEEEVKKRTNELTTANNKLSNILKERELLLKEILHRVKNNFHMITGILWFESEKYQNKDIFSELINRIEAMSKIHEHLLYTTNDLKNIEAKKYFEDVVKNIVSVYSDKKIDITFSIKNIHLELDEAITLTVIINEIINNSIKHHNNPKNILITLLLKEEEEDKILLKIKDNGNGFDKNKKEEGLGLKLINDYSEKLQNSIFKFKSNNGTIFTLCFKRRT